MTKANKITSTSPEFDEVPDESARLLTTAIKTGDADLALKFLELRFPERWNVPAETVIRRWREGAIKRVEELEPHIGREAVDLVIEIIHSAAQEGSE